MKRGFTLIELLVVVAIIGILASVVLASLNSARAKTRDTKRIAELKQMQTAAEAYYASYGEYPGEAGSHYYTNNGGSTWYLRNPDVIDQNDSRLVKFYADFSEFLPTLPRAVAMSRASYIDAGNLCQVTSTGAGPYLQYRKISTDSYKLAVRLETDCQKILNDGGTSACCPIFSGSKGRSYEAYELFSPSSAADDLPFW